MTLLNIDSLHLVESTVKNKGGDDGVRTWSTAVQILLPVAALAILWGRRGFLARFFLQFDKNCVSVFCPPFSKRQRLLKWASGRLPPTWSSHANTFPGGPAEFWRDGSLLCTLINSAIPGACSNPHRHWKRPPSHGQALAYKYLGVAPVFTETELSQNGITLRHEGAIFNYLLQVQQAITRISINELKFSSRYAARGMGLVVGEQHRRTSFYIYSSSTTSSSKHDVMVSIRGPYNTHSTSTIPAYYISRNHYEDNERLTFESKAQRSFLRSLSVDLGSFINMNQKPESDNMPIKLISENERVKVVFIPKTVGIHEISIITNGFHLVGSPFNVNITENTSGVMDSFDEGLRYPYRKSKAKSMRRKIISKIIDFIDEKVSYEKLKIKPTPQRNIPKIEITDSKDVCVALNTCVNADTFEDIINKEQFNQVVLDNNLTTFSNLNSGECINDAVTNSYFTKTVKDFELLATPEQHDPVSDNFLNGEPNILNQLSNESVDANLKLKSLNYDAKEIQQEKPDEGFTTLITPNKFSNDDFNNNTVVLDMSSSFTKNFLDNPNVQSTFTTSPICLEHIEEEVNDEPPASSGAPKWNFEKKLLRKQSNIDVSDILDSEECEEEIKLSKPTFENDLVNGKLEDDKLNYENSWNSSSTMEIPWKESEENSENGKSPTNIEMYKLMVEEINESLEKQRSVNFKHDIKTRQPKNNNIGSEPQKPVLSEQNPMNILNFLSSLNSEVPNSENVRNLPIITQVKQTENYNIPKTNYKNELEHIINFKQRLQYWESQMNLHISNKRHILRIRRSLPNLLVPSESELSIFSTETGDKQSYKNPDNSEAVEFKSQFKERQAYWKTLSTHSISTGKTTSSTYYLETLGKLSKHTIKARRSLPNLFSKDERENILAEMSYRNLCFPTDFFDSPEGGKFKTKFKEFREFWESLSTKNRNFKDSYRCIDVDNSEEEIVDDGNFDSGFYSSLPNLSAKIRPSEPNREYSDSLKYRRQYEERREYWENLSLHSQLSLNSLGSTTENNGTGTPYASRNVAMDSTSVLKETSNGSSQKKIRSIDKSNEESFTTKTNFNIPDERISHNDFHYSTRDKEWTNLTDDLKQINDKKEKLKNHFHQAKSFFKNLEGSIK